MKQRIAIFDNCGRTFDRYTVAYLDRPVGVKMNLVEGIGMSTNPFSPQGFGQHCEIALPNYQIGIHIPFADLPENCRKCVRQDFEAGTEFDEVHQPLKRVKCDACHDRGWRLMDNDAHGLRIERCDACDTFSSDEEAVTFVAYKATGMRPLTQK